MERFQVIEGSKGNTNLPFACPWCGARFAFRYEFADNASDSLEGHWKKSATCGNNRNVNNPTQSKYQEPE